MQIVIESLQTLAGTGVYQIVGKGTWQAEAAAGASRDDIADSATYRKTRKDAVGGIQRWCDRPMVNSIVASEFETKCCTK